MKSSLYMITLLIVTGVPTIFFAQQGSLDNTFGTNGKVITAFGDFGDQGNSVAIQDDQKIILGGYTQGSFTTADFALVRYLSSGDLDPTFGTLGKVTTPIEARSVGTSLSIQSDGKIVLGRIFQMVY